MESFAASPAPIRRFLETVRSSRRGISDLVFATLPQGISALAGLATSMLLARGLGAEGVGRHALVISVSSVVTTLTDLGISSTAIRFASRAAAEGDDEATASVLRWALRLRLALAAVGSVLAFVAAPWIARSGWADESMIGLLRLGLLTSVVTPLVSFPSVYLQARRRFRWNAVAASAQGVLPLAGVVALAIFGAWTVGGVLVAQAAGLAVAALLLLPLVPAAIFRPGAKGGLADAARGEALGTFARYNIAASIVVTITARADVWMMGAFLDDAEIGLYAVASRFAMPMTMGLAALGTVLWPRAAVASTREQTVALLKKTFLLSSALAGVGLVYSLAAPLATPWLFGESFAPATGLAQLLCLRYTIAILVCPIGIVGYNLGLIRGYVVMNAAQLVAVVSSNALLLPRIGAYGSAAALFANELIGLVVTALLIRGRLRASEVRLA